MEIKTFRHQSASVNMLRMHPEIPMVFLIGGFGCLTGDSLISTPKGDIPLYKFEGGEVYTPYGVRNASWPIPAQSETVLIKGGDFQIRCNGAHLLQLPDGSWISASRMLAHFWVSSIYSIPLQTSSDISLSTLLQDVQHWMQTTLDYLYCYLSCFHYDDEQLHLLEATDQDMTPLLEYALEHNPACYEDGQILQQCIHQVRFFYRLRSYLNEQLHSKPLEVLLSFVYEALTDESYLKQRERSFQALQLSQCLKVLSQSTLVIGESTFHLLAYDTSLLDVYIMTQQNMQSHVKNIKFAGFDRVYRLHVEDAECYYANGILHHNCGKSFTDVMVLMYLYQEYKDCEEPINIGIFGVTIKLLKQTVIADFERLLDHMGIGYRDNSQAGTITVGNITFIYLAMQNPDDIYAFNFHAALCDEIDEVPSDRVKKIVTAIQERCRKVMPKGKTMPERDPFIFFSTTAQGLGGTYHLIKDFDKDKIPYAIIRGRTQDNTTLAKTQLALLRKLYTEDEARAYLDGEFINLSNGRVYYEFNPKIHICMRWAPKYDDIIYVGGDFNYKYNATVETVERNGKISVINAHYWRDMGDAARGLRTLYPTQKIIFIPDASGKEIMQGFVEEFEDADIEIFWNSRNPSITERILAINKLYRLGKLAIMQPRDGDRESKLDHLIMCMETRDFDDNTGKPRKGSGPDAVDHPGDALEYAVWRIIHCIQGYDDILAVLGSVGRTA